MTNLSSTTTTDPLNDHSIQIKSNIPIDNREDEEDDPESRHDEISKHHTTQLQSFFHIVKGYIGAGVLSLPWAFSQLGVPLGVITTIVLSLLTSYNAQGVVKIKKKYMNKRGASYSDVGEITYGPQFRKVVSASVGVQQMAICTVYLSLIGENISAVIEHSSGVDFDHRIIVTIVMPFAMALSCLPNLRVLAPVTTLATALLFVCFLLVGLVIGDSWGERPEGDLMSVRWAEVPVATCAIMYSYEGINLVLPVETAMKRPSQFTHTFIPAMILVVVIYCFFAAFCVVAFGDVDTGSITAFLMMNSDRFGDVKLVYVANVVVSLSILLTYPLMMYPVIVLVSQMRARKLRCVETASEWESMAPNQEQSEDDDNHPSMVHGSTDAVGRSSITGKSDLEGDSFVMRAVLVLTTYVVAISIPNVQELISLAGALSGSSSALIIPPLLQLGYVRSKSGLPAIRCYLLVLVGVVYAIIGSVASMKDIIKSYMK